MRGINIVLIIAVLSVVMITPASATTWYVHEGELIQTAIDGASSGDTVFVYNGTYYEGTIRIMSAAKRNITLKGEGVDVVTLDGGGSSDNIGIGGDSMDNGASGCIVEGFKMINTQKGIDIASFAPDCIIRNCVFEDLTWKYGIPLYATNTTFENNIVSNAQSTYMAVDVKKDCTIVNNTIKGSTSGAGISLDGALAINCIVTKNNLTSNAYAGIELYKAGSGNKIYLNNFIDNGVAVTTAPAVTYWNSTEQIEYVYNGSTYTNYLGNYWDDYTGPDTSPEDGIGDMPYVVYGTDMDYRPLMAGFENYPAPAGGLCGDVNEDTSVDFIDVGLVGRHKLYGDALADPWAADVNGDDSIDFIDVGLIGRHKLYGDALCCT